MLRGWIQKSSLMLQQRGWVLFFVSAVLWSAIPASGAPPRSAPREALKLIRVEPKGEDIQLIFRVPEIFDLLCPMQLRIGEYSVHFREVQDRNSRTARFVISRDLYSALDNRTHQTVLTSCFLWTSEHITYPALAKVIAPPTPVTPLRLVRVDPEGKDVRLVFRVPETLDLGCPLQLRIGELSVSFREVQDRNARVARFVMSRDLYGAIDNRTHQTILTSCAVWTAENITYPALAKVTHPSPSTPLQLLRVEPEGKDVRLVFRVPETLDLGCPLQLRIGELSTRFHELPDRSTRLARFVVSRDLYTAIDNRTMPTVLTGCHNWVDQNITYPVLQRLY